MALNLLTIAEIAKQMNIPESTVRFYRDRFEAYIPSVGEGRKKRYKPEAVKVLRIIAEGYNRKLTADEIESQLSTAFPRNVAVTQEPQQAIATVQQQLVSSEFVELLQVIADQKQAIEELRERQLRLEQEVFSRLEDRERKLDEVFEKFRAAAEKEKSKWYQFWKKK
jgi:DNA-binding transcriptional MerR regulator